MTSCLTTQRSMPSTWISMSPVSSLSSTPVTPSRMASSPTTSGATASRSLEVRQGKVGRSRTQGSHIGRQRPGYHILGRQVEVSRPKGMAREQRIQPIEWQTQRLFSSHLFLFLSLYIRKPKSIMKGPNTSLPLGEIS